MYCIKCGERTKVIDSRIVEETVARQRLCPSCGYKFYTEETEVDEYEAMKFYYKLSKAKQRSNKRSVS